MRKTAAVLIVLLSAGSLCAESAKEIELHIFDCDTITKGSAKAFVLSPDQTRSIEVYKGEKCVWTGKWRSHDEADMFNAARSVALVDFGYARTDCRKLFAKGKTAPYIAAGEFDAPSQPGEDIEVTPHPQMDLRFVRAMPKMHARDGVPCWHMLRLDKKITGVMFPKESLTVQFLNDEAGLRLTRTVLPDFKKGRALKKTDLIKYRAEQRRSLSPLAIELDEKKIDDKFTLDVKVTPHAQPPAK